MNLDSEICDENGEEIFERFITYVNTELLKQLKAINEENLRIDESLKEFNIYSSTYSDIFDRFLVNDCDFSTIQLTEARKLDTLANKLKMMQLETYLHSFRSIQGSIEEYNNFLEKEIRKYENKYYIECSKDDLSEITAITTNISKLKVDIYQANEQQEQKKVVINKLHECFQVFEKIKKIDEENQKIRNHIGNFRNLPPDILEAEKKLIELKKKYTEVEETFSNVI